MHWTTVLAPLLITFTQSSTALRTTRITTTFTPTCPQPNINPGDLNLDEAFSASLTIRSGICQPVPVPLPLPYISEVEHVFVSASRGQGQQTGVLNGARKEWEWQVGRAGDQEGDEKCMGFFYGGEEWVSREDVCRVE
ncbi:hypothetical protein BJX64DRAFT_282908 [Aspergillus heterothallicus]